MKLKRLLDYDAIQAYRIISPTKRIKTMFPKKYIFVININGKTLYGNLDSIPPQFCFMQLIGYVFTYESSVPDILKSNQFSKYVSYGRTHPIGLDQYFINSETNGITCDLVLSCTATNEVMPIQMVENVIVRCNSKQLVGNEKKSVDTMSTNIKNNIRKIITNMLKSVSPKSVEEWLLSIIDHAPFNDNDMPYRYTDTITDNLFKSKSINFKNTQLSIGYDLRADSYEFESMFIHALELAFEDVKQKVTIYDTYNGLLEKIITELDRKKIKYTKPNNHSIELKLRDFWEIKDMEFEITDFI